MKKNGTMKPASANLNAVQPTLLDFAPESPAATYAARATGGVMVDRHA
jgi:hypothetical protein